VLTLTPSASLSQNEIAAAALADPGKTFNPQDQHPVRWPDHPVVALAYVDQLERSGSLAPAMIAPLKSSLAQVKPGQKDAALAGQINQLAGRLAPTNTSDAVAASRVAALRKTLAGISAQLK
jgi:hypothetical protein